jgi:uncharacterized RDD family membrane protein YckC
MTPGIIPTVIVPSPAGFWIRVVAALLDFVVFVLVRGALSLLARLVWRSDAATLGIEAALGMSTALFAALYVILLHALEGQTIGKLVVRVRVVGLDGAPPAVGASVLRFFAYFASLLPFATGFIMAGLRADRRALHDLLAGTRVERLRRERLRPVPDPVTTEPPPL